MNEQIKYFQEQKAAKRRQRTLDTMEQYGDTYRCEDCFHRKTKSCTDDLPNGCEFWCDPSQDKWGLAYK